MQCVVMSDDVMRRSYHGEGIEPPIDISKRDTSLLLCFNQRHQTS